MHEDNLHQIESMQLQAGIKPWKFPDFFLRKSITETFRPCCVGHTFTTLADFFPEPGIIVQDFLVDSSGASGGGDNMEPLMQISYNAATEVKYNILPSPCKQRFEVKLPPGVTQGHFVVELGRMSIHPVSGFYDAYPASVVFNGLTGTPPVLTYNTFFITNGENNSTRMVIYGTFSNNFSFTSLTIKGNYPSRNFQRTFDWYKPNSYATPYGLNVSESICFVLFNYRNPPGVTTDLGKVIEIV